MRQGKIFRILIRLICAESGKHYAAFAAPFNSAVSILLAEGTEETRLQVDRKSSFGLRRGLLSVRQPVAHFSHDFK